MKTTLTGKLLATLICLFVLIILMIQIVIDDYEQLKNSTMVESCESAHDKGVWDTKVKYNLQ